MIQQFSTTTDLTMASTETWQLSQVVSKLSLGTNNYNIWVSRLEQGISNINPEYWSILAGDIEYPAEPNYIYYTTEESYFAVAMTEYMEVGFATELHTIRQKVEQFISINRDHNKCLLAQYEARLRKFEELNQKARMLLESTLEMAPTAMISCIFGARSAFLVLDRCKMRGF
ncbi:hypothetical protein N7499_009516 [Penicillium canescens]|uniref:Uncharacterized protein n=2 Tax=Penicillium canescens TaxID=5083 RepID=A0AAD6INC8_PENCN|nr:hypothetical protein N7522_001387 [Penicillium canescens]KAJ6033250.1 hypothetical protein N7444_011021 [Penicillium canescens]KAJ6057560.1 hypothetical protein N7460_000834 [Penicillium canescens]KAJ6071502.1 hypothetical protein N7499_009516 [Penicillium canescens]KAJ6170182.1 hypothetical protein N7485_007528 [Penicillium canescens]